MRQLSCSTPGSWMIAADPVTSAVQTLPANPAPMAHRAHMFRGTCPRAYLSTPGPCISRVLSTSCSDEVAGRSMQMRGVSRLLPCARQLVLAPRYPVSFCVCPLPRSHQATPPLFDPALLVVPHPALPHPPATHRILQHLAHVSPAPLPTATCFNGRCLIITA